MIKDRSLLIEGLDKLKMFALISIIADLIFGLGFLSWIPRFFFRAAMGPGPHMAGAFHFPFAFLGGFFLGVLILIGAILLLIAVYAYLLGAMRDLRDYDEVSFGTPHTLVKTGYVAGLILIAVGALTLVILIGGILMIVGFILLFIGKIGLIIALFKLYDNFKESLFLVSGILYIVGIFVQILNFISAIILYFACDSVMKRT